MTGIEFYRKRCPLGRSQLIGKTVVDPEGKAGVVVGSRWEPDGSLTLRLRPPGHPDPELRGPDGSVPEYGLLCLGDAVEINAEGCWHAPAVACTMPRRQPIWA